MWTRRRADRARISPPLKPPADAQGTASAPTLDLADCLDNDTGTGLLTPVSQFVSEVKALKPDPDHQILVAAITAPASPYTVAWVPARGGQNTQPGELWPQMELSCGPAGGEDTNPKATMNPTDGDSGEPGVRISAFVNGFSNSVLASVCDPSYASSMQAIATKIGQLPSNGSCLSGSIQRTANGQPNCTAVAQVADTSGASKSVPYTDCVTNDQTPPCWNLVTGGASCAGETVNVIDAPTAPSSLVTVSCQVCNPGASVPGCP